MSWAVDVGEVVDLHKYKVAVERPYDDGSKRTEFAFSVRNTTANTTAIIYGDFDSTGHVMELANLANDMPALMYTALTEWAKRHPEEFKLPWED